MPLASIFSVVIAILFVLYPYLFLFAKSYPEWFFPNTCAFIYSYVERHPNMPYTILKAHLFLVFIILYIRFNPFEYTHFCTDSLTDAQRELWLNKSVVIVEKVDYFRSQLEQCQAVVQEIYANKPNMTEKQFNSVLAEAEQALKESRTNFESEVRMNEIVKRKLASGELASGASVESVDSPSSSKRSLGEENTSSSSKKRRFED